MTTSQREKMWKIMGIKTVHGVFIHPPYARQIADLLWHIYMDKNCDRIFNYLLENHITELSFIRWYQNDCGSNIHVGIRKILKETTGEKRAAFIWEKNKHWQG